MENVLDKNLYKKAKKIADETYEKNSAYKSMFITKKYKELGGKYKGKKKTEGVKRWNKEEWIQVKPYLERGEKLVCGGSERKNKVCRPLKRINDKTPITIEELLKLHSKKDLISLSNKKIKNMNGRVYWKTLKFII